MKELEFWYDNLKGKYSEYKIDGLKNKIEKNAKAHEFMKYVCGKSHLFELIYVRIIRNFTAMDIDLMKKWLAEHVSPDFDPQLRKVFSEICK